MESRFALRAIGIIVLLPTTLVAGFWTLLGVPALVDAIARPSVVHPYRAWLVAPLLVAGWFGLVTLWRLYYRFEAGRDLGDTRVYRAGLLAGCATSIALLLSMPGQFLAAWPLIGAVYFGWRLRALQKNAPDALSG